MAFLQSYVPTAPARGGGIEISDIHGDVSIDGDTATLYAKTPHGHMPLTIGLVALSSLAMTLTQLGHVMLQRQTNRRETFEQMLTEAPVVQGAAVSVDEQSGDIAIVFRPIGRLPLALRFPVERVLAIRQDIDMEIGGKSH